MLHGADLKQMLSCYFSPSSLLSFSPPPPPFCPHESQGTPVPLSRTQIRTKISSFRETTGENKKGYVFFSLYHFEHPPFPCFPDPSPEELWLFLLLLLVRPGTPVDCRRRKRRRGDGSPPPPRCARARGESQRRRRRRRLSSPSSSAFCHHPSCDEGKEEARSDERRGGDKEEEEREEIKPPFPPSFCDRPPSPGIWEKAVSEEEGWTDEKGGWKEQDSPSPWELPEIRAMMTVGGTLSLAYLNYG